MGVVMPMAMSPAGSAWSAAVAAEEARKPGGFFVMI